MTRTKTTIVAMCLCMYVYVWEQKKQGEPNTSPSKMTNAPLLLLVSCFAAVTFNKTGAGYLLRHTTPKRFRYHEYHLLPLLDLVLTSFLPSFPYPR